MRTNIILMICVTAMVCGSPSFAAWTSVGDGIDYQAFTTTEPNNLFVTRMSRTNVNATIDTTIAYNDLSGAREVMSSQANSCDESLSWWGGSWGQRNDVVVAINGGFFNMTTGLIDGGIIQNGTYAHWFPDMGAFSGFAWKMDRTPFIGQCIDHTAANVYVRFANSNTMAIDGVNQTPGSSDLIIFSTQWSNQTPTGSRTEVLVEMDSPTHTTSGSGYTFGTVRSVGTSTGSTWIPFGHIVLSAAGTDGTTLRNNCSVGDQVRIYQQLVEKNEPTVSGTNACSTNTGMDWGNTFATINSNFRFLENGQVRYPDPARTSYAGYIALNPRTAVCYSADYVFFVICDGRTSQSMGMSCARLGEWARDTLGATDGINLDGGGSSEMVVNGVIKNHPSDGGERAVMDGVVMVNLLPKVQSASFSAGQTATVASAANIRLGPGTNYGIRGTASVGQTATIQSHSLNGVLAKGYNWWKVNIGGTVGWVGESLLSGGTTGPPVITQQPANQSVSAGQTATFQVAATGSGTLTYQWQKNSSNLSNGGHYSGVTTTTLTVSSIDSTDLANYRCVVTNSYGSVYSDAASLTYGTPPAAPAALAPSGITTDSITWNWGSVAGATGYRLWTAASGGTQIGGTITGTSYTESALEAATPYSRYIESFNACCPSNTRTQLGPAETLSRTCIENGGFEGGFQASGVGNKWKGIHVGTGGDATFADNTTYRSGGSHSQQITVSGSTLKDSCGYVYQKLNVIPGRTYALLGGFLASNNSALHGRFGYDPTAGIDPFGASAIIDDFIPTMSAPFTVRAVTVTATAEYLTVFAGGYFSPKTGSAIVYVDDISMKPAPPTTSGGSLTIGPGQTATITAGGGFNGTDDELYWYYGPNGTGGLAGTGTSLVVGPITSTKTLYPRWEANIDCGVGTCCTSDDGPSVTITYDSTPPNAVSVTDEGVYTPSLDTLKASWTASSDSGSGISRYEYAVGTGPTSQDVRGWTSNGTALSVTITGLSLSEGTKYFIQARAVDGAGNASAGATANGITAARGIAKISDAWPKLNAVDAFSLRSKVVTYSSATDFFLEEGNCSAGIRVISPANPGKGSLASVAGVLGLFGPQRVLNGDVVIFTAGTNTVPVVAVTGRFLGGTGFNGSTPGISSGVGLYNVGLLVRIAGRVDYYDNTTEPANKYCYIDDGSGLTSAGHMGIKVKCGAINAPTGGYATMTGVVASETMGAMAVPVILIRDINDINAF